MRLFQKNIPIVRHLYCFFICGAIHSFGVLSIAPLKGTVIPVQNAVERTNSLVVWRNYTLLAAAGFFWLGEELRPLILCGSVRKGMSGKVLG
jgi:hypothetical protein